MKAPDVKYTQIKGLSERCIETLAKDFTYLTDFVFKINQSSISDLKPQETVTMLEIIISISKTEKKSVLQVYFCFSMVFYKYIYSVRIQVIFV